MANKVSVEQVENGFIVRVLKTGLTIYKDPYEIPVYVFETLEAMQAFCHGRFYRDDLLTEGKTNG